MSNRLGLLLLVAALFGAGVGCSSSGDDDDDTSGGQSGNGSAGNAGSSTAGSSGGNAGSSTAGMSGGGGTSGGMCGNPIKAGDKCVNDGMVNLECGTFGEQPPTSGVCAAAGSCCHRSSNKVKEAALCDDEPLVLEYRLNYSLTVNHPSTIGDPILVASGTARYENEQQSILWRFQAPRMGNAEVAGKGKATIGVGRYNCDGTYSYYNDKAAPSKAGINEDVGRWQPRAVDASFDPAKKDSKDWMKISFADNLPGRQWVFTPFLNDTGSKLDWELVNGGYDILKINVSGEGRDCIGGREGGMWKPAGTYEVYTPLPENDKETITLISQTYCQLVAFGILPSDQKMTVKCADTKRCMPGSADCRWKKLPDSLCPANDADRALFGCHLGVKENVNNEMGYPAAADIKCSMTKPTAAVGPDIGDGTRGQCCDPLGDPNSGLPECNAYRLIQDYVAVAAEITDTLADQVQQDCVP